MLFCPQTPYTRGRQWHENYHQILNTPTNNSKVWTFSQLHS